MVIRKTVAKIEISILGRLVYILASVQKKVYILATYLFKNTNIAAVCE